MKTRRADYTITVKREFYGPRTITSKLQDDNGYIWRGTRAEARREIAELDAAVYYTANGETGRPSYSITR